MISIRSYLITFTTGAVVGILATLCLQHGTKHIEEPLPAARQYDGSLLLGRDGGSRIKDAPRAPRSGKVEREVSVSVQPTRTDCPVCTVNLTYSLMPDGSHRVSANSPDGKVIGGLDVPLVPISVPDSHPWAAGILYGTDKGLFLDRDLGPFRFGIEASKNQSLEARLRIGIRF